jgi:hypothetical protein
MLVWWQYRCDEGHSWRFLRDEHFDERPDDAVCEHGHEAVTLQKFQPADFARIGIVPAARAIDKVIGRVEQKDQYFLELSNWAGSDRRLSISGFEWADAVRRAELFRGLEYEAALNRWGRAGLGNQLEENRF